MFRFPQTCPLVVLLGLFVLPHDTLAGKLYVNNLEGDNRYDGRGSSATGELNGPVRSISRAARLAGFGDTILVANTGAPYDECVTLMSRHSGFPDLPFTIRGNGAVLRGSKIVPPDAWRSVPGSQDVWQLRLRKKGMYSLLSGDSALTEHRFFQSPPDLNSIPIGQWSDWQGSVFYREEEDGDPGNRPIEFAHEDVGITIYGARNVRIVDLTIENYRIDAVSIPDLSTNVVLENVRLRRNGRAGLNVEGSAQVEVLKSEVSDNRRYSVRIAQLGALRLTDTKVDVEPRQE